VLLKGSFFNAVWILKEHVAFKKWCLQEKFILCCSVKLKHLGIRSVLIRFSDCFRYTDLEIILENDLPKLCKNIKYNSYLIKCHMMATKPYLRPTKKPSKCDPVSSLWSTHLEYFYAISEQFHKLTQTSQQIFTGRKWRPMRETMEYLPSAFFPLCFLIKW